MITVRSPVQSLAKITRPLSSRPVVPPSPLSSMSSSVTLMVHARLTDLTSKYMPPLLFLCMMLSRITSKVMGPPDALGETMMYIPYTDVEMVLPLSLEPSTW